MKTPPSYHRKKVRRNEYTAKIRDGLCPRADGQWRKLDMTKTADHDLWFGTVGKKGRGSRPS